MGGSTVDLTSLVKNGAKIIDVRTRPEFKSGHVKGSVNIPLDTIASKSSTLKKDDVLILCCRSGTRSGNAVRILKSQGFNNVHNGGSWYNLKNISK